MKEVFEKYSSKNDNNEYKMNQLNLKKFFYEIQEEPLAVGMLRYFYEKMPWLYVITAGSRLQSLLKKHVSFPVARVEYLNLRPFSFMEYLNAMEGKEKKK